MLGGPHIFHLTNTIQRFVGFYYKDGGSKSERQICMSEFFC
jgi:hypothetical protein